MNRDTMNKTPITIQFGDEKKQYNAFLVHVNKDTDTVNVLLNGKLVEYHKEDVFIKVVKSHENIVPVLNHQDMNNTLNENSTVSKTQVCTQLYLDNYETKSRKEIIQIFMNVGGMTLAGAGTYYQNIKTKLNKTVQIVN